VAVRRILQKFCTTLFLGRKLSKRIKFALVVFILPSYIAEVLEFCARRQGCSRSSKWRPIAKFVKILTAEDEMMVTVYRHLENE
jgi:hypothetical protein